MKAYVAGKFEEKKEVRKIQNALRKLGYIITIDWTWHEVDDPGYPSQYAVEDIIGATSCDVFIGRFIAKHDYKGALVEMGAALAAGKAIIVIGNAIDTCLFIGHPLVTRFNSEAEFFEFIVKQRYLGVQSD